MLQQSNRLTSKKNFRTSAMAIAFLALFFGAFANSQPPVVAQTIDRNVTSDEVTDNTTNLLGRTVTIRGEVEEQIGTNTFSINDNNLFGGNQILIVNASGQPFVAPNDMQIQATGEVRQFILADFEREYGWDLDPTLYAEYENRPAIVAQSLALAPDPAEIQANPRRFYGQQIAVEGEIEEIFGASAFTLDEEGLGTSNLLVLNWKAPTQTIREGQRVVVTGQVRPFVRTELERDYEFSWDAGLQRQLERDYSQKPAILADGIYSVNPVQ